MLSTFVPFTPDVVLFCASFSTSASSIWHVKVNEIKELRSCPFVWKLRSTSCYLEKAFSPYAELIHRYVDRIQLFREFKLLRGTHVTLLKLLQVKIPVISFGTYLNKRTKFAPESPSINGAQQAVLLISLRKACFVWVPGLAELTKLRKSFSEKSRLVKRIHAIDDV